MADRFPAFHYIRVHVPSGKRWRAFRGFVSAHAFKCAVSRWNKQKPTLWRYEAVEPVEPRGETSDTVTVFDLGEAEEC